MEGIASQEDARIPEYRRALYIVANLCDDP